MVYIFLDMDGVLHPVSSPPAQRWSAGHRLSVLLMRYPSVHIVVTSSYRWHLDLEGLRAVFPAPIRARVVGATPMLSPAVGQCELPDRHREVLAWLHGQATGATPWLAIDDDPRHYAAHCEQLYLTDGLIGLSDQDVEVLSERLRPLAT